jgi:hypothetical protein
VLAGLFARELEREHLEPEFHCTRLTVDLFRLPKLTPLRVLTDVVRRGRRIRVVSGVIESEGVEIARMMAVLLRRSENPPGDVWKPDSWQVPAPHEIAPPPSGGGWTAPWDMRGIGGPSFGTAARKRAWLNDTRSLVEGEPLSPLTRVALAADIASPMSNSGSEGLGFVNADITLYLHRLPTSDWLGFEVATHQADEGISVSQCTIYDEAGPIGLSTVSAVANSR